MTPLAKQEVTRLFQLAGVEINGTKPWDITINNDAFYPRVLSGGTLAFGESYMDGWWDSTALDELATKLLNVNISASLQPWRLFIPAALAWLSNRQKKSRAFIIGKRHYDIGNSLYERMLDTRMTYTCGYWKNATNLEDAQTAKLDLVCKKLNLQPGQRVLDIGCGWGSFAAYAAKQYHVEVVGITVSKEQAALAKTRCAGLPVEIRLQDYRDVTDSFDNIVSLGMFEHVGYKNYRTYMEVVRHALKKNGLFLLHTIGGNTSVHSTDPWIERYIFPNSMLPSIKQISHAAEGLFVVEDWHNFGTDYDKTLMAWHHNFSSRWQEIADQFDTRFFRMWSFYLLVCAATFRVRKNQLWQIVLSKNGVPGGYQSIR